MKVVIPIAGKGSRFQVLAKQNPDYLYPKPLIPIKGKPMVVWTLESLPFIDLPTKKAKTQIKIASQDLIFITLTQHESIYSISTKLHTLFGACTIITIPAVTRGETETVLQAKDYINTSEELLIVDCDNYFDGTSLCKAIIHKDEKTVGIIPVFNPQDAEPKWSYTLFDKNRVALAVGEKDSVLAKKGAYANIGAYYFSQGSTFVKEAEHMIERNFVFGKKGKEEFYVAPLYEHLIQKGLQVEVAITPTMWGLGTPKDLQYFLTHFNFNNLPH